jgi:hypothetical protein
MSSSALGVLIAPLVIVELAFKFLALQDLWKRDDLPRNVQMSWVTVIVLVVVAGYVAYYLFGRNVRPSRGGSS